MQTIAYRLFNVFVTDDLWSGNPLAVFENADCDDTTMQALAKQMNLSEITFTRASEQADAAVRIFTPSYEMPFAGHPTLGTAYALASGRTQLTLAMRAGVIPVRLNGDQPELAANAPQYRAAPDHATLAAVFNLPQASFCGTARFVDTGSEQLIVPVQSPDDVARAVLNMPLFEQHTRNRAGRSGVLLWAKDTAGTVIARYFWGQNGQAAEDFGTGSACANLGGWLLAEGVTLPLTLNMEQGHGIERISRLGLRIDTSGQIFVSGRVRDVGKGEFTL